MISARKFSYLSMKIRYSSNFAQFLSTKNIISLIDMLKISIKITFYPQIKPPKIPPHQKTSSNPTTTIAQTISVKTQSFTTFYPTLSQKKHPLTATTHPLPRHHFELTSPYTSTYHVPTHPISATIPIWPDLLQPCP